MAGYSNTSLARKLGLKERQALLFVNPPAGFESALGALPAGAHAAAAREALDLALLFTDRHRELAKRFPTLARRLAPAGMLWVAWPKKASKVPTDLVFERVQEVGLAHGLVDVKVCAVDDVWSGLKFVRRLADRDDAGR